MELPRKDSNWELIALLTSPLTCYRLVTERWVLLLSTAFEPERDARFFFLLSAYCVPTGYEKQVPQNLPQVGVNCLLQNKFHNTISYSVDW